MRDLQRDLEMVTGDWLIQNGTEITVHALKKAIDLQQTLIHERRTLGAYSKRLLKAEALNRELVEALDGLICGKGDSGKQVSALNRARYVLSQAKEGLE